MTPHSQGLAATLRHLMTRRVPASIATIAATVTAA